MLLIRDADEKDVPAIESMVAHFVKGHPAESHPRSTLTLRAAYFGDRAVAHLLVAERSGQIVGMVQWTLLYDMFWGTFGAEAAWLYIRPEYRGSGIVAALLARVCAQAAAAGAEFLHGGGSDGPSQLYERVAIGQIAKECHLSGKAFQVFAALDGLPSREIVRRLPAPALGLQPAER